ncbi:hypothetical protein [Stieleria varia]|uniref:Uncharacterized protein n=1 Tax=Stieleria varia TaxID=2528005 RepID=A0A5C6AHL2_9BACT|nr:hypothetical protein [Stieleria varia]TWT98675.1 hypothetical protein Pla52n_51920 [Stieleria varia]
MRLKLSTVGRARHPDAVVPINLVSESSQALNLPIYLKCRLTGMMEFSQPMTAIEVADANEPVTVKIPFFMTPPVQQRNLFATMQPELLPCQIVKSDVHDNAWDIAITLSPSQIPDRGLSFVIKLADDVTGREIETHCSLTKRLDLRLSPRTMRFSREDDSKQFVANCLLQAAVDLEEGKSPAKKSAEKQLPKPSISVSMGTKPLKTSIVPISDSSWRIKVFIDSDTLAVATENNRQLDWIVIVGDIKQPFKSPISVLRASLMDEDLDNRNAEASSLFDAYIGNLESIKDFDVAYRVDSFVTCEGTAETFNEVVYVRHMVNDGIGFKLFFREAEREMTAENGEAKKGFQLSAGLQYDGLVCTRQFPEGRNCLPRSNDTDAQFVLAMAPTDYRLIGVARFPYSSGVPEAVIKARLNSYRTANPAQRLLQASGRGAGTVELKTDDGLIFNEHRFEFDLEHSLIKNWRFKRRWHESSSFDPILVESYQWRRIGGVYVPSKIGGEFREMYRNKDNEIEVKVHHYDVEFKWVSFGERVSDDSDSIKDIDTTYLDSIHESKNLLLFGELDDIARPL